MSRATRRGSDGELRRQARGSASPVELAALDPDLEVDALGTFCPEPVIRTQNRIREIEPGQVLLLLADDSGVEVDIPAWCISTGNEYLGLIAGEEAFRVYVRRRAREPAGGRESPPARVSRAGR